MIKEIADRRSIRKFDTKRIPKEDILNLIEAASLAPSAKNKQYWYFVVVEDELKDKIGELLNNEESKYMYVTSSVIKEAPVLLLVFSSESDRYSHQSIGAAIQNILLEAENKNLGTLWIGYVLDFEDEIKKLVNEDKELVAAISVGYKLETPNKRPRKPLEEIYKWM